MILVPKLGAFVYVVEPGDTLAGIARNFNTTIDILRKFNNIPDPDYIFVGQKITVPYSPPEAIIYTVRPGDTLFTIARRFDTYVQNLIDFNYLEEPDLIFPGQQLVVTASLR
ncbi:MAG: LysM peptidoglycan-binding domain-containing protein [Bacillota bacterium]|jgi:LysM repeat protein|nr:LysM peptidoglycan-binding domain-containing protein [Clostridia bacterium]